MSSYADKYGAAYLIKSFVVCNRTHYWCAKVEGVKQTVLLPNLNMRGQLLFKLDHKPELKGAEVHGNNSQ
ncbi:MAG: hypothetical protein ACI88A_004906 [Paraglaciecola sp.]|jgi:hypothetical protein